MDYTDFIGQWLCTVTTPDGTEVPITLALQGNAASPAGIESSPAGEVPIEGATYSAGVLRYKIVVDGNEYPHVWQMSASDQLTGTIDFGGGAVPITAQRAAG